MMLRQRLDRLNYLHSRWVRWRGRRLTMRLSTNAVMFFRSEGAPLTVRSNDDASTASRSAELPPFAMGSLARPSPDHAPVYKRRHVLPIGRRAANGQVQR